MASAEPVALAVQADEAAEPLRLTWDPNAVASPPRNAEPKASPWEIDGEIDWQRAGSVRLLSASFEEGRAFALAALRPRNVVGHGRDSVASYLVEEGEPVTVGEALLSTEYDADGLPRRVGVEVIVDPEAAPLRIAGDREGPVEVRGDGARREAARMSFRLEGMSGSGLYEVLRAP